MKLLRFEQEGEVHLGALRSDRIVSLQEGVGGALKSPRYLDPGDVVRCEVEGVGAIENTVAPRTGDRPAAASLT